MVAGATYLRKGHGGWAADYGHLLFGNFIYMNFPNSKIDVLVSNG